MIRNYFFLLTCFAIYTVSAAQPEEQDIWLDAMHRSIAGSVQDTAQWFDDFFQNDNFSTQVPPAQGEARIRFGWEPRSRDLTEFDSRLRVRVKLPKLKNQADLVFSDYDEEDPDARVEAARSNLFDNEDRFNLALRWRSNTKSGLSHRLGIGRRFQVFARSRYQKLWHLSETNDIRWQSSIDYYNRDKFGFTTRLSLDHAFSNAWLLKFNNNFFYRERTKDWLWQHNVEQFIQSDGKSAFVVGTYIEGRNQPNYRVEEYLASVRWRKNTLREWLFFEVEPFVLWRRDEDFKASYGVALRVEGFFGKNG